jgi:hypothetical protein
LKTLVISEFGGKQQQQKKKPHVYRGMEFWVWHLGPPFLLESGSALSSMSGEKKNPPLIYCFCLEPYSTHTHTHTHTHTKSSPFVISQSLKPDKVLRKQLAFKLGN